MGKLLTSKQEAFCLAYLVEPDASKAYRKVYSAGKMADKTVWECAARLLADRKVAARVAELRKAAADQAVMTEADILREVGRLALSDPRQLQDAEGKPIPLHLLPIEVAACIAGFEYGDDGKIKKYKLWDKNSSLEKAMKHYGSFEQDNKQRAGVFDGVPRERVQEIHDKLRSLAMADQPAPSGARRFTH